MTVFGVFTNDVSKLEFTSPEPEVSEIIPADSPTKYRYEDPCKLLDITLFRELASASDFGESFGRDRDNDDGTGYGECGYAKFESWSNEQHGVGINAYVAVSKDKSEAEDNFREEANKGVGSYNEATLASTRFWDNSAAVTYEYGTNRKVRIWAQRGNLYIRMAVVASGINPRYDRHDILASMTVALDEMAKQLEA